MLLNINKVASHKTTQNNLLSSQNFLQKNKIVVNEVTQTHYSVQGVQAYSPEEIKALKETQERKKNHQGTVVEVKVYQCGDYFDEFEEGKELTPKEKVVESMKNKSKLDMKNESLCEKEVKEKKTIKIKDKVEKNNNVVVKLEREREKKSAIEQKLSKLSKKYKEFFKGSQGKDEEGQRQGEKNEEGNVEGQEEQEDYEKEVKKQKKRKLGMYESLKKMIKVNDDEEEEEEIEEGKGKSKGKSKSKAKVETSFKKGNQKAFSVASTNATKPISNKLKTKEQKEKQRVKGKEKEKRQQKQESQEQDSDTKSQGKVQQQQSLQDKLDSISCASKRTNKSTYSQKLGSAVHSLFR